MAASRESRKPLPSSRHSRRISVLTFARASAPQVGVDGFFGSVLLEDFLEALVKTVSGPPGARPASWPIVFYTTCTLGLRQAALHVAQLCAGWCCSQMPSSAACMLRCTALDAQVHMRYAMRTHLMLCRCCADAEPMLLRSALLLLFRCPRRERFCSGTASCLCRRACRPRRPTRSRCWSRACTNTSRWV